MKWGWKMENKVDIIILGPNNWYTLGLVRCIGSARRAWTIHCIVWHAPRGAVFCSRYPDSVHFVSTPDDSVSILMNKLKSLDRVQILLPANDYAAAAIDNSLDLLDDHFLCATGGGQGAIIRLMDKVSMGERAKRFGFRLPKTVVLHKGDKVPDGISYPVFTKSCRTIDGGKCDEFVCHDEEELRRAIHAITSDEFFISEYVHKKYERNFFGVVIGKEVFIPIKDERKRFRSGEHGGYCQFSACGEDDFVRRLKEMIGETGYTNGMFDIEFIEDQSGILYFMEINFRNDGCTSRLLPGINLPLIVCKVFLRESDWRDELIFKRKYFVGINEPVDFRCFVCDKKGGILHWLFDFARADSRLVWDFKDPMPVLFSVMRRIWGMVGNGLNCANLRRENND